MWQIAESMDDQAIEQFNERYPKYRAELMSRMTMVRGIKGSRPIQVHTKTRFLPSPQRLNSEPPRWVAFAAATFLLAAGVFATLGTLKFVESRNAPPQVVDGTMGGMTANNGNNPTQSTPPKDDTTAVIPPGEDDEIPIVPASPMDKKVTIVAKNISLENALNDIALQAGIRLESAPGMPSIIIELDYRDISAIEVLKALGISYGFTPMIQTPTSALLIPARDPNSPTPLEIPGRTGEAVPSENGGSGLAPLPGVTGAGETGDQTRSNRNIKLPNNE